MKQGSTPSLPVRRISSNSFEVLENSSQNSSSTRKRRKKHSKPSLQDEFVQEVLRPATPTHFLSATNSPNARLLHSPFTPERRPLERSLTDLTTLSQAHSASPPYSPSPARSPSGDSLLQNGLPTRAKSTEGFSQAAQQPQQQQPASPQRHSAQTDAEPYGSQPQAFWQYVQAELNPMSSVPAADPFWGQTERQRVYNAILYVPYQLERLVSFGMLICADSFLAIFTVVPVRFVRALYHLCIPQQHHTAGLQGQQLFDTISVFIFASAVCFLCLVNAGALYFWMKDLTQEFLKLHVIATAVEILDKIACCFVNDSMEALSGTCTTFVSSPHKRRHLAAVCMDAGVCWVLVLGHALVLMCQGMAFSVAMNSKRAPALMALIIASNFAEVKGTVFKRFDATKLFSLTCQDVVERFHLMLALAFVLAEEMVNASRIWPNVGLLWQCAHILGAEVAIDVLKHAVLGRFNEIRPGVYREFTFDVSERVQRSQSHNIHRVVGFEPLASAALFLRILLTFVGGQRAAEGPFRHVSYLRLTCIGVAAWSSAMLAKAGLGFWLHNMSHAYADHYQRRFGKVARPGGAALRSVTFAGIKGSQSAVK